MFLYRLAMLEFLSVNFFFFSIQNLIDCILLFTFPLAILRTAHSIIIIIIIRGKV